MKATPMDLVKQRDDLVIKIASERMKLSQNGNSVRPLMKWVGRVNGVLRYFRNHPEALILPAVVMTISWPRRLAAVAISGWSMWRLMQKMRRKLDSSTK